MKTDPARRPHRLRRQSPRLCHRRRRPNHGTDRGANAGARRRASGLVALILNPSLVVDLTVSPFVVRTLSMYPAKSKRGLTLTDGVEFERHLGPARDLAGAGRPCEVTVDGGPSYNVTARRTVRVNRSPSRDCFVLRVVVQNGHQSGSVRHEDTAA
jgi:hypothetical protein